MADSFDKPQEACGLFGIYAREPLTVARLTYFGLYALQHRGQESAGIAVSDGKEIRSHLGMGLVSQVFNEENLKTLEGFLASGHVRYSTTGTSHLCNAQPIIIESKFGPIALSHNGNLVNTEELIQKLRTLGYQFKGSTDSEVIAALISYSTEPTLETAVVAALKQIDGAYTLIVMSKNKLIGLRDPVGLRPLAIGDLNGSFVLASESCGLDIIGAKLVREVSFGEMVVIDENGLSSQMWTTERKSALCVFEFIYLARPDSVIGSRSLYSARVEMGRQLAIEFPSDADLVVPVPDSGNPAAIGYAEQSGIPFSEALIKNRYVGRTFIQPNQELRDLGVRLKLNPIPEIVSGKRVVLVDDSIVRGTTSRQIVRLLKEAGAREVHMRVSSPPIISPCYYGIDTASKSELIGATMNIEEIRRHMDADTIGYLSLEGMLKAIRIPSDTFCKACLTGHYPIKVPEKLEKLKLIFK